MKRWQSLQPREQIALAAGAIFLVVFGLMQWVVFPVMEALQRQDRRIQEGEAALVEIALLGQDAARLQAQRQKAEAQLQQRRADFSLFAYLEDVAGATGVKSHIAYMKPSQVDIEDSPFRLSRVEVKLDGLGLDQLTRYLHRIEHSTEAVSIRRLSADKGKDGSGAIDVVLQVETLEK